MDAESVGKVEVLSTTSTKYPLSKLAKHFTKKYKAKPAFFVRVPSILKLIGEHADYNGYPAVSMALDQDITMGVGIVEEPMIFLTNLDAKYDDFEGDFPQFCGEEDVRCKWYKYVLCGVAGIVEIVGIKARGLCIAVQSTIPSAAGLSSSTAIVCASALAMAHACKLNLTKEEIAAVCAKSERRIGTESKGMDQAIAFLACENYALYITWNRLSAILIKLPQDFSLIIVNSLVEANKSVSNHYNNRVKDCKMAARMILMDAGINVENKEFTLSEAQMILGDDLNTMLARAKKLPLEVDGYKPCDRAIHVFTEALRVQQFRELCGNKTINSRNLRVRLGRLIRESHKSLKEHYECSHPELDRIVSLSDDFGVYAKLTVTEWGGCVVVLCPKDKLEKYYDMLGRKFYKDNPAAKGRDLFTMVSVSTPQRGACIYQDTKALLTCTYNLRSRQ